MNIKSITSLLAVLVLSNLSVFAQNTDQQFDQYFEQQLRAIGITSDKTTQTIYPFSPILSEQEQQQYQKKSDIEQDINQYVDDQNDYSITGELNEWDRKRILLYRYVQTSNWLTWRNISDADRAFTDWIQTVGLGLAKQVMAFMGTDLIFDRVSQKLTNEYESSAQVKYLKQAVEADIDDIEGNNSVDEMYIKIQSNAFYLLSLNHVDYLKLVKAYPEVAYLFEDLYTFFKWRYQLRTYDPNYKLNENNINVAARKATHTNSFFAWWELANIAKASIRASIATQTVSPTPQTVSDERDNMEFFQSVSKRALYFGRLWNGIQRYLVRTRHFIPKRLDPKRGVGMFHQNIGHTINHDMQALSNQETLDVLNRIRQHYVVARQQTETFWQQWLQDNAAALQEQRKAQRLAIEARTPELNSDDTYDHNITPVQTPEIDQQAAQQVEEDMASVFQQHTGQNIYNLKAEEDKQQLLQQLNEDNLI